MKKYTVYTKYTFEGKFFIEADSKEEAKQKVLENCGVMLGPVSSTLDDATTDWNFGLHSVSEKVTDVKLTTPYFDGNYA